MAKYRNALPQMGGKMCLTDGGLETVMVFQKGIELAEFAAIDLIRRDDGAQILSDYISPYVEIALASNMGLVIETATWRASPDWGAKLGFASEAELAEANRYAVRLAAETRAAHETDDSPIVVSGNIGPRGDGYDPGRIMSVAEAADYHGWQARLFASTEADMIGALTMTNAAEALGVALAARTGGMPVTISFTVETDGHLPTGQSLGEAIDEVDKGSGGYPVYYMVNCAHPTHFAHTLDTGAPWVSRVKGIRANASKCSHEELDSATELDDGNPAELGMEIAAIRDRLPHITVVGGCCGTDHRHIGEIAHACNQAPKAA